MGNADNHVHVPLDCQYSADKSAHRCVQQYLQRGQLGFASGECDRIFEVLGFPFPYAINIYFLLLKYCHNFVLYDLVPLGVDVPAVYRSDGVPAEACPAAAFHRAVPLLLPAQVLCAEGER